MRYTEIRPSDRFARYVKCFWTLESSSAPVGNAPEPVMPDGSIELIFNFADPFRRYHADGSVETQPRSIIAGQMRGFAVIEACGGIDLFGVRFMHAGAAPFFRFPINELTDQIPDLNFVLSGFGRETEARMQDACSTLERVSIIEEALLGLLERDEPFDRIVEAAAGLIAKNSGSIPIDRLANSMGVNGRRLERQFQQKLGLSPKRFSRIIRFQGFLNAAAIRDQSILDTALSFGYYDQAHLIREFREFSGKTPAAFFENEHKLSEVFLLLSVGFVQYDRFGCL
jgi:AraC-like DNA-binding protein